MPLEAAALFLDIGGFGAPLWFLCGRSIDLLLSLAHFVGGARGAVAMLPSMPGWAFALIVSGGLWLCLWNSRVRLLGLVPILAGAVAAVFAPAPALLVTGDGMHLAVIGTDGTPAILRDRSGDFVREVMTESSGFDGEPSFLADARFADCSHDSCVAQVRRDGRDWRILATRSSNLIDWAEFAPACARSDVVVSDRRLPRGCRPRWLKLDSATLRKTGGVAVYLGAHPRVVTVAERLGEHPWAAFKASAMRGGR